MSTSNWQAPMQPFTTVEMLLDDVSLQMASSNMTRYSRGSTGHKPGNSIRVIKPNSTSNSPRGSTGLSRRRTVMNDGAYRRRMALMDQRMVAEGGYISNDSLQVPPRSNRPVSWHPSSHLAPQPMYQPTSALQTPDISIQQSFFEFSPTPAIYSEYTSPASAFSPLSMPYSNYENSPYPYQDSTITYSPDASYAANEQILPGQPVQMITQQTFNQDPSMYSHFDWNNCGTSGFENSTTAPPTPENFLPIQHPEPTLSTEEAIPYHPLSDDEDGEEELVGMGLYDSPEPLKAPSLDPQLDNYRALMMSSLFGAGARRVEPTGKGLKLEETWVPPSDDEDEDEDDEDGEGEEEEDLQAKGSESPVTVADNNQQIIYQSYGEQIGLIHHTYNRSGWL